MKTPSTRRRFPGWEALFSLDQEFSRGEYLADLDLGGRDEFALVRGEWRPRRALPATRGMGFRHPGPAVWTRWVAPLLLADKIVEHLRGEGLTGWDTYPVKLEGKDGAPMPRYRGLVVTGRCGPVDDTRARKVRKRLPGGRFPVWKGMYFEEATWDGSDFFMPAGNNGRTFTTMAVVEAFRRANVKNVKFTPLPEVERLMP